MPTKIVVGAVPERAAFHAEMRLSIPDAVWVFDEKRSAMDTFLRVLKEIGDGPGLCVEDDVVFADDFVNRFEAVVAERPDVVVQFFSMRKADVEVGSRWDRNFLMNQCFYLPAGFAKAILVFEEATRGEAFRAGAGPTDVLVREFLNRLREPYWIHVPNLVDHRVAKSLVDPRRSSKRQSKTFGRSS
jgi:GR25 family glycosyltransferase involved in LPS biosynthesis